MKSPSKPAARPLVYKKIGQRKRDALNGKQHIATGRSFRSASFRILVGLGNCPNVAPGGQQNALLAMRAFVGRGLAPAEM